MSRGINPMSLTNIFYLYIIWVKVLPQCEWIMNYDLILQKQETLWHHSLPILPHNAKLSKMNILSVLNICQLVAETSL